MNEKRDVGRQVQPDPAEDLMLEQKSVYTFHISLPISYVIENAIGNHNQQRSGATYMNCERKQLPPQDHAVGCNIVKRVSLLGICLKI